jgi:hypothetical protein
MLPYLLQAEHKLRSSAPGTLRIFNRSASVQVDPPLHLASVTHVMPDQVAHGPFGEAGRLEGLDVPDGSSSLLSHAGQVVRSIARTRPRSSGHWRIWLPSISRARGCSERLVPDGSSRNWRWPR